MYAPAPKGTHDSRRSVASSIGLCFPSCPCRQLIEPHHHVCMGDVRAGIEVCLVTSQIFGLFLLIPFLDLDVPSDGFLHQPMGRALLRLTKLFEPGTGFVVKFDAHGGCSHVCLIDCKWNGEYMLWSQPRLGC